MDRFGFIAANAAKNTMLAQAVTAHNLANVSTTGFKADMDHFASRPVYGPGHASRAYAEEVGVNFDGTSGSLSDTGNPLDMGIAGDGWFSVQTLEGEPGLTRRGDFRTDASGFLINGEGQMLRGSSGAPIAVPPHEEMLIANDGTITIRPQGAPANALAVIDRIALVNPQEDKLSKRPDGLFAMKDGSEPPVDAQVHIRSGMLESSNVNAVQTMVEMIELSRAFEAQMKILEKADELGQASEKLLAVN